MLQTSPSIYLRAFEHHQDGRDVLDDLIAKFGGPSFVAGSPDQTAYNCGAKAVIEHILMQIDAGKRPAN